MNTPRSTQNIDCFEYTYNMNVLHVLRLLITYLVTWLRHTWTKHNYNPFYHSSTQLLWHCLFQRPETRSRRPLWLAHVRFPNMTIASYKNDVHSAPTIIGPGALWRTRFNLVIGNGHCATKAPLSSGRRAARCRKYSWNHDHSWSWRQTHVD